MSNTTTSPSSSGFLQAEDCHLEDLLEVIGAGTDLADYPHADSVAQGVLVYDSAALRDAMIDDESRRGVRAEVGRALADGPGIVVFRSAFGHDVVDRVSEAFERTPSRSASRSEVASHQPLTVMPRAVSRARTRLRRSP